MNVLKNISISGIAKSPEGGKDTRFEIPVHVRVPEGCEDITLEWDFVEEEREDDKPD